MDNNLDMEMHILNEIILKAHGTGAEFDENMSRVLNEKVMEYIRFRSLEDVYTTDSTVFHNFEGPCQIGRISDDGNGFLYID